MGSHVLCGWRCLEQLGFAVVVRVSGDISNTLSEGMFAFQVAHCAGGICFRFEPSFASGSKFRIEIVQLLVDLDKAWHVFCKLRDYIYI